MANRIEIELTSARDEETYTWRAAGARQPRGLVPTSLLPPHSKIGDVLRAEVEVEIEGITVISILPAKEKARETGKIEFIGPSRDTPLVTTVLAGRSDRRGGYADLIGDRKPRRTSGDKDRPRRDGESAPRREAGASRAGTPTSRRPESRRPEGADRSRPPGESGGGRSDTSSRRQPADRARSGPPAGRRESAPARTPARKGPARFEPATAHRDEFFASLSPEQRPIAERLALGGLPAIRKALTEEQQRARAEGRPAASGETIIALAEQLQPEVKAALWLDRAEAAIGRVDEITLRDLRATVVGAAARDEAGRTLERQLREALDRRVTKLRQDWEQHLQQGLEDGRVLQALRLSAKPPEPTARFPGTLAVRLAELAGEAMTAETSPDRWLSLLEAGVESPVRRQIKPTGMPKDPSGDVERHARMAAGRIPALARLLGMPIPPPPKPVAGERPTRPTRPPRRRPANRGVAAGARAAEPMSATQEPAAVETAAPPLADAEPAAATAQEPALAEIAAAEPATPEPSLETAEPAAAETPAAPLEAATPAATAAHEPAEPATSEDPVTEAVSHLVE